MADALIPAPASAAGGESKFWKEVTLPHSSLAAGEKGKKGREEKRRREEGRKREWGRGGTSEAVGTAGRQLDFLQARTL